MNIIKKSIFENLNGRVGRYFTIFTLVTTFGLGINAFEQGNETSTQNPEMPSQEEVQKSIEENINKFEDYPLVDVETLTKWRKGMSAEGLALFDELDLNCGENIFVDGCNEIYHENEVVTVRECEIVISYTEVRCDHLSQTQIRDFEWELSSGCTDGILLNGSDPNLYPDLYGQHVLNRGLSISEILTIVELQIVSELESDFPNGFSWDIMTYVPVYCYRECNGEFFICGERCCKRDNIVYKESTAIQTKLIPTVNGFTDFCQPITLDDMTDCNQPGAGCDAGSCLGLAANYVEN